MAGNTTATTNGTRQRKARAVFLQSLIEKKYAGEPLVLSKATTPKIPTSQIKRWLEKDAVVVNGEVYLCASKFDELESHKNKRLNGLKTGLPCVDLQVHIDREFNGVESAFAEATGAFQQQVNRWGNHTCLFIAGQVYRKQRALFSKEKIAA